MYFIQAQKGRNEWWRYVFTILVILFAQFIGTIPLIIIPIIRQFQGNVDVLKYGTDPFTDSISLKFFCNSIYDVLWS
jgi:hypothetical protein